MNKISLKIMLAIMVCSVVTTTILCIVSINTSSSALLSETEKTLILSSEKYANEFSSTFKNTEGMVDAIASNVNVSFDLEEHRRNPEYFNQYEDYLEKIIKETLQNNENLHGLYFTFSPHLTNLPREVWYSWDSNNNLTKISADFGAGLREFALPAKPDMEYFYDPIQNKTGAWTGPYMDPDISLNMISYSSAVFAGDVVIGVAGADILTSDTIGVVETMKIYEDSRSFLLDENLEPIITPPNFKNSALWANRQLPDFSKELVGNYSGTIRGRASGSESILAYSRLSNDWILVIEQPLSSVYSSIRVLTAILVGIALIAIFVSAAFAVIISQKFSKPIFTATERLKQLGMGDYTHPVPDDLKSRKDDLGEFAQAISSIQKSIADEANQNREKDILLIYQSKQAKIGEMVGNISHQWKQPLNNINLILLNLYDSYIYKEMSEISFKESMDKIMKIVRTMWETIDDFTQFLKPSKDETDFDVSTSVALALELMEDSIMAHNIIIKVDVEKDLILFGYPNEFSHVLFNVLNNARDAITESNPDRKEIHIRGFAADDSIILEISNKGNLIPQEILDRVFEPYMTTKEAKDGTGIGLYISRVIIEQRMSGNIQLSNTEDGVCCTITLKPKQE